MKRFLKVFLIIILVLANCGAGVVLFRQYQVGQGEKLHKNSDEYISREEWINKLETQFGKPYKGEINKPKSKADGEFVALTAMSAVGEKRLSYYTDRELTDEVLLELSNNFGIVQPWELDSYINNEQSDEVIKRLIKFYANDEYYPEYSNIVYQDNVIDFTDQEFLYDEQTDSIVLSRGNNVSAGSIILLRDVYGTAFARKVLSVENDTNGNIQISSEEVTDLDQVVTSYDFSGKADFSYLEKILTSNWGNVYTGDSGFENVAYDGQSATAIPLAYVDSETQNWEKINLDFKAVTKGGDDWHIYTTVNGHQLPDAHSVVDTYKLGNSTKFVPSEEADINKDWGKDGAAGYKNAIELEINNLAIYVSGSSETANVEYIVTGDCKLTSKLSGNVSGEISLPEMAIPVAGPYVTVVLKPKLIVGAEGSITASFEIDGVNVMIVSGQKPGFYMEDTRTDILDSGELANEGETTKKDKLTAKTTAYGGVKLNSAILISGISFLDPYISMKAQVGAEVLEEKEGFEWPCVQTKIAVPIVEVGLHDGGLDLKGKNPDSNNKKILSGSLVGAVLECWDGIDQWTIIDEDTAYHWDWHLEYDEDGFEKIEGDKSVCTHELLKLKDASFEEVISDYKDRLARKQNGEEGVFDDFGTQFALWGVGEPENFRYTLYDIDKNGTDELIIGNYSEEEKRYSPLFHIYVKNSNGKAVLLDIPDKIKIIDNGFAENSFDGLEQIYGMGIQCDKSEEVEVYYIYFDSTVFGWGLDDNPYHECWLLDLEGNDLDLEKLVSRKGKMSANEYQELFCEGYFSETDEEILFKESQAHKVIDFDGTILK